MQETAAARIEALDNDALVLDVGGWNKPLPRANWVIDLMPHETRGAVPDGAAERFTSDSWVEQDICARRPWPFTDGQFDFVVCSHTLEDVRDPVWVCEEMNRVAKAGYIETPSRLEEQTWGVNGDWVGWSHHHWLVDLNGGLASFTLKPHFIHGRPDLQLAPETLLTLPGAERVCAMFWEGELRSEERIHYRANELEEYLREPLRQAGVPSRSEHRRSPREFIRSAMKRQ